MDPLFEEKGDWKFIGRHPLSAEYENMTGEPWQDFLGNLKEVGIVNNRKIVLYQGQVLDGWQLYRGCLALNIEPQFRELPQGFDPEQYVKIANDLRRKEESSESIQQRAANRRARVAAARANGQSTRTIATAENVSHVTILNDISAISESPSGGNPYQLETEQPQQVTSDGLAPNSDLRQIPLPPNGKIVGQDGKQYPAVKQPPAVLCVSCERRSRKGQELPAKCPDCKLLQPKKSGNRKRKPKPPVANTDGLPKSVANALADTWHGECARLLSKMRVECKAAFSWSSWLDAAVLDHLKAAEECFVTAMPRRACPDCKGQKSVDGEPCRGCRMGGYLASQV